MNTEVTVYAGLLAGALFWALLSGILLLGTTHEVGRWAAWYWAAVFVGASFVSAWLFFELLEGGA